MPPSAVRIALGFMREDLARNSELSYETLCLMQGGLPGNTVLQAAWNVHRAEVSHDEAVAAMVVQIRTGTDPATLPEGPVLTHALRITAAA